jgi:tetratricopeptide (TPR) repeat protein
LLLLGHALLMTDAVVSAETAYRQALLLRPRHSETRIGLAKALLRQERYREGQALLAELLQQDPLNRELWSLRTSALLADQQLDLAIQSLEQARRLQQASPEMLATLGDLWLNAEQPADALNAYRQAFETETPSLPRILRAAEGFLIVQDLESAHAMLQKAESLLTASTDPKVRQQLLQRKAEHALQAGDLVTATALLQDIVRKDPLAGGALILLSQVKWQEGHIEQALLGAERAARIDGFEAEGLRLQARIEVSRGHYRQAVPLIEAAQAFEPQEAVARYLEQVKRLAD